MLTRGGRHIAQNIQLKIFICNFYNILAEFTVFFEKFYRLRKELKWAARGSQTTALIRLVGKMTLDFDVSLLLYLPSAALFCIRPV